MSMRQRYAVATNHVTVVDLLALDAQNPRSILYQLTEMKCHMDVLPGAHVHGQLSQLSRDMIKTHTSLAVATPETLTTQALMELTRSINGLSEGLAAAYVS